MRKGRSETGQTAAELMGVLLVVAAVVVALATSGLGAAIGGAAGDLVAFIAGGGTATQPAGGPGGAGEGLAPAGAHPGGGPGQGGQPGQGATPGGGTGQGGQPGQGGTPGGGKGHGGQPGQGAAPGGGTGQGGQAGPGGTPGGGTGQPGDPGRRADDPGGPLAPEALSACLAAKTAGYCLKAFDPARYFVETRPSAALDRVDAATKRILTSGARTGSPEFDALVAERQRAVADYLRTKPISRNGLLRGLNTTRKVLDPRAKDIAGVLDRFRTQSGQALAPRPNTASGGPVRAGAASRFLSGASKVTKGLGIVGTALGLYNNVKADGAGKGVTETAGGVLGGWAAGSAAAAGCAALAVTGVGAVACGAGVLIVSFAGSKAGQAAAGAVYDHVLTPAGHVIAAGAGKVAEGTKKAAGAVVHAGGAVLHAGGTVLHALNPFG